MSDGRKKEIYRDVQFFHGAIQLCIMFITFTAYVVLSAGQNLANAYA